MQALRGRACRRTAATPRPSAIMTTDTDAKAVRGGIRGGRRTVPAGRHCQGLGHDPPQHGHHAGASSPRTAAISPEMLRQGAARRTLTGQLQHGLRGRGHLHQRHGVHPGQRHGGQSPQSEQRGPDYDAFCQALDARDAPSCAAAIARDGEGATKLLECQVTGRQGRADRARGGQVRHLLQPGQGGHVRRRRQLGPGAVRHRLFRARTLDVKQDRRVGFASAAGSVAGVPRRRGRALQRGNGQARCLRRMRSSMLIELVRRRRQRPRPGAAILTYDYVKINGDYRT